MIDKHNTSIQSRWLRKKVLEMLFHKINNDLMTINEIELSLCLCPRNSSGDVLGKVSFWIGPLFRFNITFVTAHTYKSIARLFVNKTY